MKSKLTPEINTVAIHLIISNIDWPKSGWSINKIKTEDKSKKLNRYFIWEFLNLSKVKNLTVVNMKNGFNNSIGCNLKKYKLSHLLAPFTSIPTMGTKANKMNEIINNGKTNFFNIEVSIAEIPTIIDKANIVNVKCFEKKK